MNTNARYANTGTKRCEFMTTVMMDHHATDPREKTGISWQSVSVSIMLSERRPRLITWELKRRKNHPDDPGGSTMTSETTRIIECWIKENHDWVRHPEFEIHYDNN